MRVVVTRPREQARELVERLEACGHEVVVCPLIEIEPIGDGPIDVSGYDWVIVTSVNGARELRRRARGKLPRLAAIGGATAAALGGADLVPRISTQEGLLAELPRPAGRVLFAGAEGARRLVVKTLGADFLALYRTRRLVPAEAPSGDLVVVTSPSGVQSLAALGATLGVVSIGPQTTRAARAHGLEVLAEAQTHDLAGLVAAVQTAARKAP